MKILKKNKNKTHTLRRFWKSATEKPDLKIHDSIVMKRNEFIKKKNSNKKQHKKNVVGHLK